MISQDGSPACTQLLTPALRTTCCRLGPLSQPFRAFLSCPLLSGTVQTLWFLSPEECVTEVGTHGTDLPRTWTCYLPKLIKTLKAVLLLGRQETPGAPATTESHGNKILWPSPPPGCPRGNIAISNNLLLRHRKTCHSPHTANFKVALISKCHAEPGHEAPR